MSIKPLHDWIIIETDLAEEKSLGGIILPDTAQTTPAQGVVVSVGEGKFIEDKDKKSKDKKKKKIFISTTVKPGDHIMYEKYGIRKVSIDGKEKEWVLVREEDVLGHLIPS
jgi:chaperonin GroES